MWPGRFTVAAMASATRVRPFEAGDIPAAGALLAARHRVHRLSCPLLSPRYEDKAIAAEQVAAAFALPGASGAVALAGREIAGFVLGAPKPSPAWGPNVWVDGAGQAVTDPELLREMYGLAATRWVQESRIAHYVLVPASDDELLRAWFRLGFGQQHAHALRALPDTAPSGPAVAPGGLFVRPAQRGDLPALARLEVELPRHQSLSPVFSAATAPSYQESLAGWEEDFDDTAYATFVAELDGEVIGSGIGCALELSGRPLSAQPPRPRGLPRLRRGLPARARSRSGPGTGRSRHRMDRAGRLRLHRDRLAGHKSALLPHLAQARLHGILPAIAPSRRLLTFRSRPQARRKGRAGGTNGNAYPSDQMARVRSPIAAW